MSATYPTMPMPVMLAKHAQSFRQRTNLLVEDMGKTPNLSPSSVRRLRASIEAMMCDLTEIDGQLEDMQLTMEPV